MKYIANTVASDEHRKVETLQDRRAFDASMIDDMDLDKANHATHSQDPVFVLPSPHLSASERAYRSASDEELAAIMSATPAATPNNNDGSF